MEKLSCIDARLRIEKYIEVLNYNYKYKSDWSTFSFYHRCKDDLDDLITELNFFFTDFDNSKKNDCIKACIKMLDDTGKQFIGIGFTDANYILKQKRVSLDDFFGPREYDSGYIHEFQKYIEYSYNKLKKEGVYYEMMDIHMSFIANISDYFIEKLKDCLNGYSEKTIPFVSSSDSLTENYQIQNNDTNNSPDDYFDKLISLLNNHANIDGEPINTDLVYLYNILDDTLDRFIRKLSLTSFDSKNHRYINQCISNINELDFFKDEDLLIAINEYNNHKFNDSSLDDCMCEIRLAKGEIDYNKFPFIISQLHKLCSILNFDDDDDIETTKIICNNFYLQPYICHFFATKAINELKSLISFPSDKHDTKDIIYKKKLLQFYIGPKGINSICDEMVNSEFIDKESSKLFIKFLKQEDFDQNKKINWQSNPTNLYSLIKTLKKEKIIHFPKWKVLNDYFIARDEDYSVIYDFTLAGNNLKETKDQDAIDKINKIVGLFKVFKTNSK